MRRDVDTMERVDGEHEPEGERDAVELTGEARAKADAIGELGELVRGRLERAADDVPDKKFAAMWREIDKGIERDLAATPAKRASAGGVSFWRLVTRFFDRYRAHIITGAVTAGVVAALAIVLRPGGGSSSSGGHDAIDVRPVVHRPAEIEDLDTPGGTGTVFNLEDEDGSTTVIWVTPEDTVEGI
jgi:hypothetical protein